MIIDQTYTSDGPVSASTGTTIKTPATHPPDPGPPFIKALDSAIAAATASGPDIPPLARLENVGIVCTVVNGIVTPNLQILLASVLGTIDASIPNKEQNRAVKHLVRKQFDDAYIDIQRRAYPDCAFGASAEYYLEPNAKAFQVGTIRA